MDMLKISICRCCGSSAPYILSGTLLEQDIEYFECILCGYVQTEDPQWLHVAYAQAINDSDTGIMQRNQANSKIVLSTLLLLGRLHGVVVDCAGGYGILVRLLRDYGVNALWSDPYCANIFAKGFERTTEKADLVTAFEVFEHFADPAAELDKLLSIAPNVLISTVLISDPAPKQDDWWYYGREHGQHIGFFRVRTLEKLASSRGKYLVSNGNSYHLITDLKINRLLWKVMILANRLIPLVVIGRLKSKVRSDYNYLIKADDF